MCFDLALHSMPCRAVLLRSFHGAPGWVWPDYHKRRAFFASEEVSETIQWVSEYCFTSLSAQSWQYRERRNPEAGTMPYSYFDWLQGYAQYHRQHRTLHAFEQFRALYNHDDKIPGPTELLACNQVIINHWIKQTFRSQYPMITVI